MRKKLICCFGGVIILLLMIAFFFTVFVVFYPFKQEIDCSKVHVQIINGKEREYILVHLKDREYRSNPLFPMEMINLCYIEGKLTITRYISFNIFTLGSPIRNTWPIAFSDDWVKYSTGRNVKLDFACWNGKTYQKIGIFCVERNSGRMTFHPMVVGRSVDASIKVPVKSK